MIHTQIDRIVLQGEMIDTDIDVIGLGVIRNSCFPSEIVGILSFLALLFL